MLRSSTLQAPSVSTLPWSPPSLTSPTTFTVTNDPTTRSISLSAGQDAIIQFGEKITAGTLTPGFSNWDGALITVSGGRNVVVVGGHLNISRGPTTTVSSSMANGDMSLTVASTAGFPGEGSIRVDGEAMVYSSITGNTFNITARNYGFFNTSAISSNTTHAIGANVYLHETYRSAFAFGSQTGTVHVEGVLIEGYPNDGLRFSGQIPTVTVQNCRVGPVTAWETSYDTDGHPDCTQFWGGGAVTAQFARNTYLCGAGGRGILNAATDVGVAYVNKIVMKDMELCRSDPESIETITNSTSQTVWDVQNCWLRSDGLTTTGDRGAMISDTTLIPKFNSTKWSLPKPRRVKDIVAASSVGMSYLTPGYLS